MAVKFITCYPILTQGGKTPCGIAADKQSGMILDIICPDIPEELCRILSARWNDRMSTGDTDCFTEEAVLQFITEELQRL